MKRNEELKQLVEEKFTLKPTWVFRELLEEVKQDERFRNGNGRSEMALKQVLGSLKTEGKVAKLFRTTRNDFDKTWKKVGGLNAVAC